MLSCGAGRSQNDETTCFEISEHIVSWFPHELTLQALTILTPRVRYPTIERLFLLRRHTSDLLQKHTSGEGRFFISGRFGMLQRHATVGRNPAPPGIYKTL